MKKYFIIKFDICFIFLVTLLIFIKENDLMNKAGKELNFIFNNKFISETYITRSKFNFKIKTFNKDNKKSIKNLKLKRKGWFNYTPFISRNSFDNSIKAIILPSSGIYHCGKIIDKVLSKINWNNYEQVILLSISYIDHKNYKLPDNNLNLGLSYNNFGNLEISNNKKGNIILSSIETTNNDDRLTTIPSFSEEISKGIEAFNKENSWQTILPFLLSLNKKIKLIPLIIGSYSLNLENKLFKYIQENPKTLLVVNTDLLHCGLYYSTKCPLGNSAIEFNNSTIQNIRASINNDSYELDKKNEKLNKMSGYKSMYLFSKLCRRLGLKSGQYFYHSRNKENKRAVGYLSMVVIK